VKKAGNTSSDSKTDLDKHVERIKKLQEKVRFLERDQFMFRALLETVPDNIYFKDRKSRFLLLSKAMIDWFGAIAIGDVRGKTDFDIFSDEHAYEAYEDEQNIMKSGVPIINKEEKETWEDGRITWVSTSKVPLRKKSGKITGIVGISHNITEKKETESKLKKYRENLEETKLQTDNILANVKEGLFLLNQDYIIAGQHSRELRNILEESKIANRNLLDILRNKVDPEILDTTRQYLELLFDDEHDEIVLEDLNPLYQMEMLIHKNKKYLTFNFRRIKKRSGQKKSVIVTVNDVTKEIMLQQSLEEEKAQSQRKMDWMLCILNIDPRMLKEFITSVQAEMAQVDDAFQELSENQKENEIMNKLYRSLHTIKGNASLLELDFLADQVHHAENVVSQIKNKMKLVARDRKELKSQIGNIHKIYDELKELINHIAKIHDQFRPKRSHEQRQLLKSLEKLCDSLSENYNKKIKFDHSAFDSSSLPYEHRLLVRDILVQLVRNSVYHGIETMDKRSDSGKPKSGNIKLTGENDVNNYIIKFFDDGQGINLENLREKSIESGKWPLAQINRWTDQDLLASIFEPGITTADSTDITAGRGIGLDLIRNKIRTIGGTINVESKAGESTCFTLTIPVKTK
jgi:PAS domain S-box-containing protein